MLIPPPPPKGYGFYLFWSGTGIDFAILVCNWMWFSKDFNENSKPIMVHFRNTKKRPRNSVLTADGFYDGVI